MTNSTVRCYNWHRNLEISRIKENKMKKIISILMLSVLLFTLCSCIKGKNVLSVEKAISEIGTVTIESEEKIVNAEQLYEALKNADKKKVENYASLTDARSKFESIKNEFESKYNNAVRYLKQEKIDEAIALFEELGDFKDAKDYLTYSVALSYCQVGDYESGYKELQKIPNFAETTALLGEIYYETILFEGLKELRSSMKNPDSLKVNEVMFTYNDNFTGEGVEANTTKEFPACIAIVSGQNGLGGYSTSYALFIYQKEQQSYMYMGSCSTLKEESGDDLYDLLVKYAIQDHMDRKEIENPININRVNAIIESKKYISVKRIPDLTFEKFSKELSNEDSSNKA